MRKLLPGRNWRKAFSGILLIVLGVGCHKDEPKKGNGSVPYHIGMGKVFYRQGDYLKAVEMYQKALCLDPASAEACLQLGVICDDNLKDDRQAAVYYRKYLLLEPKSEMAELVRGWLKEIGKKLPPEEGGRGEQIPSPRPALTSRPIHPGKITGAAPRPSALPGARASGEGRPGRETSPANYTVKAGDTLAGIAEKIYGDRSFWKAIYQENRNALADPGALHPGQILRLPPPKAER